VPPSGHAGYIFTVNGELTEEKKNLVMTYLANLPGDYTSKKEMSSFSGRNHTFIYTVRLEKGATILTLKRDSLWVMKALLKDISFSASIKDSNGQIDIVKDSKLVENP